MNKEIWKDIDGYEGRYQVSNMGQVKNKKNKILKTHIEKGYYRLGLSKNNKSKHFCIHRLVAKYFINNPDNKKKVFHKDGNKLSNKFTNLKWYNIYELSKPVEKIKHDIEEQKIEYIYEINKDIEIWKNIVEYEDLYEISTFGRIRNKQKNKLLKLYLGGFYYTIQLTNNNKRKTCQVHRLIAKTFIRNPAEKRNVDHIDNNKLNNNVTNLRWATHSENAYYYHKNHSKKTGKAVLQYDMNNNFIKEWSSVAEIVEHNQTYRKPLLYNCISGKYGSAYGYVWKYKNKEKSEELIVIEKDEKLKNIGTIGDKDFNKYKISNYGKVKSLHINKFMKILINQNGYHFYNLRDKKTGKGMTMLAHRLVAKLFVNGETKTKNVVNHIDENKKNNYYKNLEWVTQRENVIHSHGKKVIQLDLETGEKINTYRSIIEAAHSIYDSDENMKSLRNNVKLKKNIKSIKSGISKCCREKIKYSYGYNWEYAEK